MFHPPQQNLTNFLNRTLLGHRTKDKKTIIKRKSKVYVTKRWHVLAIINKNLPFTLYKRM